MRFVPVALLFASACAARAADPWRSEVIVARHPVLPGSGAPRVPPKPAAPSARSPAERLAALPARVASEIEIRRSALDAALAAGPQRFMAGILLDPFFVDRKFVGFRLTRFYEGDPRFAAIDLRRGDVVLRVNGQPIGRPEEFMRVWDELRTADEIRVDYLRGADKRVLRVRVR